MTLTIVGLTLATLLAADPEPTKNKPREPNPFAPSLPLLTPDEEEELDRVIDQFILYDSGRLRPADGPKAKKDFEKLGPEAIPALIRGLNRAAAVEHSCPVVVIAKKLRSFLTASTDLELLDFARENIGAGVGRTRHGGVLQDLRFSTMMRRNAVARLGGSRRPPPVTAPPPRTPGLASMTVEQLAAAAGSERGARLEQVLTELEKRQGDEVVAALAAAAASYERATQQLARGLLAKNLSRLSAAALKEKLGDDRTEVRLAAAVAAGQKTPPPGAELVRLLDDAEEPVRDAAHQVLVRLNRGVDLGPNPGASDTERAIAVKRWRAWWDRTNGGR